MIVAHPDDETLWGGAHIADGGYLVVCITNGYNATRSAEFQAVMQASNNVGLILSYPDKVAGKRDDWTHVRSQIQTDLEKVMTYQPWEDIVTHNAKGAVTLPDVQDSLTPISDDVLQQKEALLQLYTSQAHTIQNLSHMNPYEMWTQIRGGSTDDDNT